MTLSLILILVTNVFSYYLTFKGTLGKDNLRKRLYAEIVEGTRTLFEAVQEDPTLINGYSRLKLDIALYFSDLGDVRLNLPWALPNPWSLLLPSLKKSKQRHYWIFSRLPNLGKTTMFAIPIQESFKSTIVSSNDSPYWNLKGDEQAVILDEYNTARLKYDVLNSMCDGTYTYRRMYVSSITLKRPLIIVLSNQPLRDLYPNMYALLEARFKEIEVSKISV